MSETPIGSNLFGRGRALLNEMTEEEGRLKDLESFRKGIPSVGGQYCWTNGANNLVQATKQTAKQASGREDPLHRNITDRLVRSAVPRSRVVQMYQIDFDLFDWHRYMLQKFVLKQFRIGQLDLIKPLQL